MLDSEPIDGDAVAYMARERAPVIQCLPKSPPACLLGTHSPGQLAVLAAGALTAQREDDCPYLSRVSRQVPVVNSARQPVLLAAYTGGRTSGLRLPACNKCNATPPFWRRTQGVEQN